MKVNRHINLILSTFSAGKQSQMFLNLNRWFIYWLFFRNELAKLATKGELLVANSSIETLWGQSKTSSVICSAGLCSSTAQWPLVILWPLGEQEIIVFTPSVYPGTLNFKGLEILGTQLLFLEHKLDMTNSLQSLWCESCTQFISNSNNQCIPPFYTNHFFGLFVKV